MSAKPKRQIVLTCRKTENRAYTDLCVCEIADRQTLEKLALHTHAPPPLDNFTILSNNNHLHQPRHSHIRILLKTKCGKIRNSMTTTTSSIEYNGKVKICWGQPEIFPWQFERKLLFSLSFGPKSFLVDESYHLV